MCKSPDFSEVAKQVETFNISDLGGYINGMRLIGAGGLPVIRAFFHEIFSDKPYSEAELEKILKPANKKLEDKKSKKTKLTSYI